MGLNSLSGKTSYRKISWSLEAARFGFKLFQSLWNLAGTSAALLPRCLSNFRAIRPLQHTISRLRDFTRFGCKTSYRLVNRGPWYTVVLSLLIQSADFLVPFVGDRFTPQWCNQWVDVVHMINYVSDAYEFRRFGALGKFSFKMPELTSPQTVSQWRVGKEETI